MSKLHTFSPEAVRLLLKKDKLLAFRHKLLVELENKEETEALENLYQNLILDDPFRSSEYLKILAAQAANLTSDNQKNNS